MSADEPCASFERTARKYQNLSLIVAHRDLRPIQTQPRGAHLRTCQRHDLGALAFWLVKHELARAGQQDLLLIAACADREDLAAQARQKLHRELAWRQPKHDSALVVARDQASTARE